MSDCERVRKIMEHIHVDEVPPEVFLSVMNHLDECPDCEEWLAKVEAAPLSEEADKRSDERANLAVAKAVEFLENQ
jgi:predicted anti-sigma-YlaC factor YlaD